MTETEFREAYKEARAAALNPKGVDRDLLLSLLWDGTVKPALAKAQRTGYVAAKEAVKRAIWEMV